MSSFDRAARELFKGWSTVTTYRADNRMHVHLTLDERAEKLPPDKGTLLEKLFGGTDAPNLMRMVQKQKKRYGLKCYGRKR